MYAVDGLVGENARQGFPAHNKQLGMYAKANVGAVEIETGGFYAGNFFGLLQPHNYRGSCPWHYCIDSP